MEEHELAIRDALQLALTASGHSADQAARTEAMRFLAAHADEVHSGLVQAIESNTSGVGLLQQIALLAELGRDEAVPVLVKLLDRPEELVIEAAGAALGRHRVEEAFEALKRALRSGSSKVVSSAADGLLLRNDPRACPELLSVLAHPDAITRYHVVNAAAQLGCLSKSELDHLATSDSDPDVRSLAANRRQATRVWIR